MATTKVFCAGFRRVDRLLSFDVRSGYRHFSLHEDMRSYLMVKYDGRYFRCKAIPVQSGRSRLWFVNLLKPFVRYIMETLGSRFLPYTNAFLLAPSIERASTERDFFRASREIRDLMEELGLERHEQKGVWGPGATVLDHLGVTWNTEKMEFTATEEKVKTVIPNAQDLLGEVRRERRWLSRKKLASLCCVAVSMMITTPLERFYTRALHDGLLD